MFAEKLPERAAVLRSVVCGVGDITTMAIEHVLQISPFKILNHTGLESLERLP
jgi:hypothetical protein